MKHDQLAKVSLRVFSSSILSLKLPKINHVPSCITVCTNKSHYTYILLQFIEIYRFDKSGKCVSVFCYQVPVGGGPGSSAGLYLMLQIIPFKF